MPGHRVHAFVDREFFGKAFWKIHRIIDEPVFFLGKRHRELFHDPVSAVAIADQCYPGDPNARSAAILHLQLDDCCTENPAFRKQLEFLAEWDSKKRKRAKKKNRSSKKKEEPPLPPALAQLENDLKKMAEIQKLARLLSS